MKTSPARLALSWALVVVLLGYGVIQTGITAAKLFRYLASEQARPRGTNFRRGDRPLSLTTA